MASAPSVVSLAIFLASWPTLAADCPVRSEPRTVRGDSLAGLAAAGTVVRVLFGHYACHTIARDDVVAFRHVGRATPLIKIVRGLPGDSFHLKPAGSGWHLVVAGRAVTNSLGEPYLLGAAGHRLLALYETDYKGAIPANAYLLLGNLAGGSLDSTRFGLVDAEEILGKVVLPPSPK